MCDGEMPKGLYGKPPFEVADRNLYVAFDGCGFVVLRNDRPLIDRRNAYCCNVTDVSVDEEWLLVTSWPNGMGKKIDRYDLRTGERVGDSLSG